MAWRQWGLGTAKGLLEQMVIYFISFICSLEQSDPNRQIPVESSRQPKYGSYGGKKGGQKALLLV